MILRNSLPAVSRVCVDRDNTLCRGLTFLVLPGHNGGAELMRGYIAVRTAYAVAPGRFGSSANFTTTSGRLHYGPFTPIPLGSSTYTVACLAAPTATALLTATFGQGDASGSPFPNIALEMNSDVNGNNVIGKFSFSDYNGGFNASAESDTTRVDGVPHVYAGTRNGTAASSVRLYLDGADVTSAQQGTGGTQSATPQVTVGNIFGLTRAANYPIWLVAVWARALTTPELYSLGRDPYQLLAPMRRPIIAAVTPSAGGFFARDYYDMIGKAA